jgi:DNA-binding NarL/FixJ family response regulator
MTSDIRIVFADDHPFFRDGVRTALAAQQGLRLIAEASDGVTALEYIRSLKPDVAILDIGMPKLDGVGVVRKLREERIPVAVVFLTVCKDEDMFEEALDWDVKGYLLKDCTGEEMVRCVQAVAAGQHYTSPSLTTYLVEKTHRLKRFSETTPALQRLTRQERSILRLIAQDRTSKEIAQALGIAPKTVDTHRASICKKLEIHGNYALRRFAALHRPDL